MAYSVRRAMLGSMEAARRAGLPDTGGPRQLGDIVVVDAVREARERGVLRARPMFDRLTERGVAWAGAPELDCDVIIWCTGFRPALRHLAPLRLRGAGGRVVTGGPAGTQAVAEPRLYLVGYGDWTGPASATLVGVGRTARDTAAQVLGQVGRTPPSLT